MATTIIRPSSVVDDLGFNYSGGELSAQIGDDDQGTTILQGQTECYFTVELTNDSAYTGGTFSSLVVNMTAFAGRSGDSTCMVYIDNSSNDELQSNQFDYTGTASTESGEAYDAGGLSSSDVDGLRIRVVPNGAGVEITEVFLTIVYTAAAPAILTAPGITLSSGKLVMTGKITY